MFSAAAAGYWTATAAGQCIHLPETRYAWNGLAGLRLGSKEFACGHLVAVAVCCAYAGGAVASAKRCNARADGSEPVPTRLALIDTHIMNDV